MAGRQKGLRLIIEFIVAIVGGMILHSFRLYTNRMLHGWRELTNYAIGVIGSLPFVWLFWRGVGDELKPAKRGFVAYLLGFLGVGTGAAMGWLIDTFTEDK